MHPLFGVVMKLINRYLTKWVNWYLMEWKLVFEKWVNRCLEYLFYKAI